MTSEVLKRYNSHHEIMAEDFRKRFLISLFATLPVLLLSPLVQELIGLRISFLGDKYVLFFLSSIVFFYGGSPFFRGSVKEFKKSQPGMMTLVTVAISVAYFYSQAVVFGLKGSLFFWELVTLIDIMLLGHWIEMRSVLGASKALERLVELLPSTAHAITQENGVVDMRVSRLTIGNFVLVKPGEKIPVDGLIIKGQTTVNEAMLTGESKPVFKQKDDKVIAGSINGEGSIQIKVTTVGENSYISQIIKLIKKAEESKSKTQDLANRAALWLTIIALYIGIITLFSWFAITKDSAFSLERMVTVMVTTCPHALGLAVPLVVAITSTLAAKKGVLIRNRIAFENARNLQVVIFDKTGTLTKGEFGVTDIIVEFGYAENDILFYAASLESNSEHPIGKGILKKAKEKGLKISAPEDFVSFPGKGVKGIVNGKDTKVVGQNYLKEKGIEVESRDIEKLMSQGKTVVYILVENKMMGAIALADLIREEAKAAVKKLKSMGIKSIMLTGDSKKVARWVAKEVGINEFFAEILPDEKVEVVKKVRMEGVNVAMVGDGVNDAAALVQADVGIAIGAGSDVALESADVVLVRDDPRDVIYLINLAKVTYSKMRQNLLWAVGYNIVAIPLAAGVLYNFGILLSPAVGAILMSLSTIIVAINATFLSI